MPPQPPTRQDILDLVALLRPRTASRSTGAAVGKIRLGNAGDGGYVVSDDLDGIDGVISLGIDNDVSFDRAFADRGIDVHQYDHTIPWAPQRHPRLRFHRTAWGPSNTRDARNLDGILSECGLLKARDMVLKFDVESAEWECLPVVKPSTMKRFRIVVCELHGLTSLAEPTLYRSVAAALRAMSTHHVAVHAHANNCCPVAEVEGVALPAVLEVSWLRRDRARFQPGTEPIPGPLDAPNVAGEPEIVLPPWLAGPPPS